MNEKKEEVIEIKKANLLKTYEEGCSDIKRALMNLCPEYLKPTDVRERVKTFHDACEVLGEDPDEFYKITMELPKDVKAYMALRIISRALNGSWIPDWTDSSQYKYVPWFKHCAGSGLAYGDYGLWLTHTTVGSRLCYASRELAEYAGTQFAEIYKDYLTI